MKKGLAVLLTFALVASCSILASAETIAEPFHDSFLAEESLAVVEYDYINGVQTEKTLFAADNIVK